MSIVPDWYWKHGRIDSFKFTEVVAGSDINELQGITGGKITRNYLSELKQSGSIEYAGKVDQGWIDKEVRVYLKTKFKAEPSTEYEFALGTFLTTTPKRKLNDSSSKYSIQCYSMLIKLKRKTHVGIYSLPAGTNVIQAVLDLCYEVGLRVRYVPSEYVLSTPYTSNDEDTYLSIVNALLDRANYGSISVDAYGTAIIKPYIPPSEKQPSWIFNDDDEGVYLPEIDIDWDVFDKPNELIIVASDSENTNTVSVRNEDPNDMLSIPNRGIISKTIRLDYYDSTSNLEKYGKRILEGYKESIENHGFKHWYVPIDTEEIVILRNRNIEGEKVATVHTMDITLEPGVLVNTSIRQYIRTDY